MSLVLGSGDPKIRDQYLELGSGKPKTRYRLKHKVSQKLGIGTPNTRNRFQILEVGSEIEKCIQLIKYEVHPNTKT